MLETQSFRNARKLRSKFYQINWTFSQCIIIKSELIFSQPNYTLHAEMKGPSLEAIRRFKEQQEKKKRDEDERKIRDKLSTLEHRASQGDRKAKQELKRIERIQEQRKKIIEHEQKPSPPVKAGRIGWQNTGSQSSSASSKAKKDETDFDELMRLAKQNNNEIRKPEEPSPKPSIQTKKSQPIVTKNRERITPLTSAITIIPARPQPQRAMPNLHKQTRPQVSTEAMENFKRRQMAMRLAAANRSQRYDPVDEDDDDEDEGSDLDDFVVDDDEEDVQAELSQTLKSVFRYDKRRCDRREAEIDRQYRIMGNSGTFEDLEREERRASRLAAAEDARAQREEDERKRLKKLRLEKASRG